MKSLPQKEEFSFRDERYYFWSGHHVSLTTGAMPLLVFDGEIKDRVTPKSGPGTPNPIALSATQCAENKELALWQRRKNVWLGLTAVKLAQGVGFVLHQRALGSGKWLLTVCWLLTVPPKGRGNSTQDPFAYTSIPQFGLKP